MKIFTISEPQLNQILGVLGDVPAKNSFHAISTIHEVINKNLFIPPEVKTQCKDSDCSEKTVKEFID